MASSSILSVLQSSEELAEPIRVMGLTRGARALLLLRWAPRDPSTSPLLVICETNELAEELAEDISTLSEYLDSKPIRALAFPGWDHSPYSTLAPSIRSSLARIALLSRLAQKNDRSPQVVTTTLPAASHRTLSLATLEKFSFILRPGESIESREELGRKLSSSGYLRVDSVEDRGCFAIRGDLIDVFPPEFDRPFRVELWGDEIESIRYFNPQTQRTENESIAHDLVFGPAREVLIHSENAQTLRERIKHFSDEMGVPRSIRDPLLSRIYPDSYPEFSPFWAHFAYGESAKTLMSFCPWNRIALVDSWGISQAWDLWLSDQRERAPSALQSGVILPPVELEFDLTCASLEFAGAKQLRLEKVDLLQFDALGPKGLEPTSEELLGEGSPTAPPVPSDKHTVWIKPTSGLKKSEVDSLLGLWKKQGFRILVLASTQSQAERVRRLLEEKGIAVSTNTEPVLALPPGTLTLREGSLSEGFRWPAEGLIVLNDSELLGTPSRHKSKRAREQDESAIHSWSNLQATSDLSVGDVVVHIDHGLGRYQGIVRLELNGAANDYLQIEYAKKDRLYLPIYRLNVIQKYAGGSEAVALDTLGSGHFAKAKEKAKEAAKKVAIDLLRLYAERKVRSGIRLSPSDSETSAFEATFPFDETPDQLNAIEAVYRDLESGRVMDRLICGDVGYGKTEVAIRAAFKAVYEGLQVVVLVPTTVLAHQHEQSFKNRIHPSHPAIRIESVSRFKTPKEQKEILEAAARGEVDILIGTHRLLSKDSRFKQLGLVIIDEEHRFGVEHKEKLKTFRTNTHVMTLTATPIPRTLNMALSGLRDISLMNTAPIHRLPIRTYVSKWDDDLARRAIDTELSRGGQVFIVHNRVQSIYNFAEKIKALVPRARVGVGHGQLPESELEKVMMDFYEKRIDVLVATTIIESGLDVPSANTILIDRADALGLAQLYQLRGRVGRGQSRAYAYLFIPAEGAVTEDAKKRLEVIQKFVELGSGFSVASHDLEIRGGGDLLGAQQSGHIQAVGFDLYTEMLEEAIRELEGKPLPDEDAHREPEIKVPFSAFLPEDYVTDTHQRLSLYRRLSGATEESQIDEIEVELRDRFGRLPETAMNLLWLIRTKRLLKRLRIDSLTVGPERMVLNPGEGSALDPIRAIALVSGHPKKYSLTPDSKFIAHVKILSLQDLYHAVSTLLSELSFRD